MRSKEVLIAAAADRRRRQIDAARSHNEVPFPAPSISPRLVIVSHNIYPNTATRCRLQHSRRHGQQPERGVRRVQLLQHQAEGHDHGAHQRQQRPQAGDRRAAGGPRPAQEGSQQLRELCHQGERSEVSPANIPNYRVKGQQSINVNANAKYTKYFANCEFYQSRFVGSWDSYHDIE